MADAAASGKGYNTIIINDAEASTAVWLFGEAVAAYTLVVS